MPKLTLKDWLSRQMAPPEIQADIENLFALPENLKKASFALGKIQSLEAIADTLEKILGTEKSS